MRRSTTVRNASPRLAKVLALVLVVASCQPGTEDAVPAASRAQPPSSADRARAADLEQASLRVVAGHLIDGRADAPRQNVELLIDEGIIAQIERSTADGPNVDSPIEVLDLSSYWVLPGLVDLHVHLTDRADDTADLSIYFDRTEAEQQAISAANALTTLETGFTAARNVGAYIAWSGRDLRDRIDRGEIPGPRLHVAGFYLTIPGGGGDLLLPGLEESEIPVRVRRGVARGSEEFAAAAEAAARGGADVLKIIASGAVLAFGGIPGEPEMTPEEIAAVVEVGRRHAIPVTAHAHGARSIREAILAGVDSIEHASMIDDEGIALAIEHDVSLVMDVYCGDYIESAGRAQGWPEEFLRKNLETTEVQRQGFTRAVKAGAKVAFGTDAAVYPHGDNAKQFSIMVQRGMTPMQAIQSATSVAAAEMGFSGDGAEPGIGSLVEGYRGDLIAVARSPLEDISELERVLVVVKDGRIVLDRR